MPFPDFLGDIFLFLIHEVDFYMLMSENRWLGCCLVFQFLWNKFQILTFVLANLCYLLSRHFITLTLTLTPSPLGDAVLCSCLLSWSSGSKKILADNFSKLACLWIPLSHPHLPAKTNRYRAVGKLWPWKSWIIFPVLFELFEASRV